MKKICLLLLLAISLNAYSQRIQDLVLYIGNGTDSAQIPGNINGITRRLYAVDLFRATAARKINYTDTSTLVATQWYVLQHSNAGAVDTTQIPFFFVKARASLATVAVTGNYNDLSNRPTIPTNNNQLTNGSNYLSSIDTGNINNFFLKVRAGLSTVAISGVYNDLTGKPSLATVATTGAYNDLTGKPTIPTNNNQLTNGSGYLSSVDSSNIPSFFLKVRASLATVAISGSYNDLLNKPTIPTNTNQLTNGSGYLSAVDTSNISNFFLKVRAGLSTVAVSGSYNDLLNKPTLQAIINGTGFVKATGTTLSYDNSTYLTSVDSSSIPNFFTKVRASLQTFSYSNLPNGILKGNGTTTLSAAIAGDFPTLNQNTTGSAGSISASNIVTNSNLSNMNAHTMKGNNTAGATAPSDLTVTQVTAELNTFTTTLKGLVPSPGSVSGLFLKDDGTWASPAGGGFTNPMTTQGDIIYENATPGPARLAGNATATKKFLVQTSSVPSWDVIAVGDVPTLNQSTTGTALNITGVLNATSFPAMTGDVTNTSGTLGTTVGGIKGAAVPALSAGFLKTNGTTWSFDASTYLTTAVTSIATGWGTSGGTITGTGTIIADSFNVDSRLWRQKLADSINAVKPDATNAISIGGINFSIGGPGTQRTWSLGVGLPGVVARMVAASAGINTTETALLSSPSIAANQLTAGSTYRIILYGTCTSTVANASNIRVRIGTTGGNTDAIVGVVTPTAATSGTGVPFKVTFLCTVRTTGSSGTMAGEGDLNNNGVTGISAAADVIGTVSSITVNTTVANIISLWYVSAATTTTSTFQIGTIECVKI